MPPASQVLNVDFAQFATQNQIHTARSPGGGNDLDQSLLGSRDHVRVICYRAFQRQCRSMSASPRKRPSAFRDGLTAKKKGPGMTPGPFIAILDGANQPGERMSWLIPWKLSHCGFVSSFKPWIEKRVPTWAKPTLGR